MNALKKRRRALHITQEQLAARLSVSGFNYTAGTISHWENNRHFPEHFSEPKFRAALAHALEWDDNEMMREFGFILEMHPSSDALRAAELVDKMPPEKRSLAIGLLEEMLKH